MRLDEEKLEALRSWGERLRKTGGEESAAVGRAILMLVEEIDRLHIDLWHARMEPSTEELAPASETIEDEEQPVASSLQARLHRVLRRNAGPAANAEERPAPDADAERAPSSAAEAWIASLRRQK
jgi:hypothetical protein